MGLMEKIFGTYSERELKRIKPILNQVLALEDTYKAMSDAELKGMTAKFKDQLAQGYSLETILPDAFAVCREAGDRVLGLRAYPVQILGAIVLHQGRIAEMRTGEGKTLVAAFACYLNALTGNGVHVVTVNEYLAKYGSEQMGKIYRFLGLSVGLISHGLTKAERQAAYACDITYTTNNELGFDYLRDNMVVYKADKVQRGHHYCIVDEADSILIDEARTPLIISGQGDKSTELYTIVDRFVRTLKRTKVVELNAREDNDTEYTEADYLVDEKARTATLTPNGVKKAENYFGIDNLTDPENMTLSHHINQAIKAHGTMHKDIDYVIKDEQVVIVDEHTGRLMEGRRYNEGLHQAIEAKEGVKVQRESKTLATITFQNYFRMYKKLAGMTGTALTEEDEFREIYNLDVLEIPTNRPVTRIDHADSVYKTQQAKYNAVIDQIVECYQKGQPVLVGTVSVEKSEMLSELLKRRGVPHNVLNAKQHAKEAEIVAQAGVPGAVTIATNMAGRGTDIMLGGNAEFLAKAQMREEGMSDEIITEAIGYAETDNEAVLTARARFVELNQKYKEQIQPEHDKVVEAGGLFIIGTERHDARRIDNQLRGRSGRQGDPGESRFYLSLEDDLMRLFGGESIQNMMNSLGLEDNVPIENRMLTRSIESAQRNMEARNFSIRKSLLQYDDVLNRQREIIYGQREKVLNGEDMSGYISNMIDENIDATVDTFLADDDLKYEWNFNGLRDHLMGWITGPDDLKYEPEDLEELSSDSIKEILKEKAHGIYRAKEEQYGPENMREIERVVLLRNVDSLWMDHIDAMDELKRGMSLRSYAQKNPIIEYRIEGFEMFDQMVASIRENTIKTLLVIKLKTRPARPAAPAPAPKAEPAPAPVKEENPVMAEASEPVVDAPAEEEKVQLPERQQILNPVSTNADDEGNLKETVKAAQPAQRIVKKIGRNDPCPCGSGKKYKKCCGKDE